MELASLAVTWHAQGRELRVRQREELRRALNRVAEIRTWVSTGAVPPPSTIRDVENFTQNGLVMIQRELRQELADKRKEVSRLRELAIDLRELAEGEDWRDPVEVAYSHTVRKAEGLGTKTETLTLADTGEAEEAAAAFERKIEGWEKLRSQMQDDLEHRMRRLKEVAESVSAFALFSTGVVAEVLAIL